MDFKQFIEEQAIAKRGNWDYDISHIGTLTELVFNKSWKIKDTIIIDTKEYSIIKHNNANTWAIGSLIKSIDSKETIFDRILFLEMENSKNIGHKVNLSPLYRAKMIGIKEDMRGFSIAKKMYKYLVKVQGYNIIGDTEQFFGARKLWASLSKDTDIIVDIIDTKKGEYIEKDVTLHHGTDDWDFDKRTWDYSDHLEDVRLILKDIK
ncbi:MAG: hypothetical protein ACYDD5_00345 [Sulfuricurvum sp.]